MRAVLIVVDPSVFDGPPSVGEGEEPVLVQALVSEPAVEALDEAVLLGLPRVDEAQPDATLVGPLVVRPLVTSWPMGHRRKC